MKKHRAHYREWSWVSSVSIVSDYRLDDRATRVHSKAQAKDVSFGLCPDQLWGPPSLLSSRYQQVLSPGVKCSQGVMLTTHPHLVPRSKMSRSILPLPLVTWMVVVGQLYPRKNTLKGTPNQNRSVREAWESHLTASYTVMWHIPYPYAQISTANLRAFKILSDNSCWNTGSFTAW
jgi:hypothetical protein